MICLPTTTTTMSLLLLVLVIGCVHCKVHHSNEFEFFVYTQQWPSTVCTQANITHRHVCAIAQNVTTWTIHGLWPSTHHGMGPSFCNTSSPFSEAKITNIEAVLLKYWPNLYTDSSLTDFWAHEWNKHGTCASADTTLSDELHYFSAGLKLNRKYDISSILSKSGIIPDDRKLYAYDSIMNELKNTLGKNIMVQCYYDKHTHQQYLFAVEMCLDKQLNIIDCDQNNINDLRYRGGNWCNPAHEVAYPTIHHAPANKCTSEDY